jgi:FkbM family methyltransferase
MGGLVRELNALRWDLVRALQVARIGAGPLGRARVLWAAAALWLKQHTGRLPELSVRVRWRSGEAELSASLSDLSELWVLREVFVLEHYALAPDIAPGVIVDLGSNVGISVLYFASRFPQARIVAVEAEPGAYERLRANTGHLHRVTAVHAAIADHDGQAVIFSGDESWGASTIRAPEHSAEHVVPAMTLDRLAEVHRLDRIDLLKMDVEGAEVPILRSAQALRRAGTVIFEFHREHSDEDLWSLVERVPELRLARVYGDTDTHPLVTLRSANGS